MSHGSRQRKEQRSPRSRPDPTQHLVTVPDRYPIPMVSPCIPTAQLLANTLVSPGPLRLFWPWTTLVSLLVLKIVTRSSTPMSSAHWTGCSSPTQSARNYGGDARSKVGNDSTPRTAVVTGSYTVTRLQDTETMRPKSIALMIHTEYI